MFCADGIMHSDQEYTGHLSVVYPEVMVSRHPPVLECALDLYLMEQRWHAGQDMSSSEKRSAVLHQVRDSVLAIADSLLELGSYQRDGLCLVKTEAPGQSLLGQETRLSEG